MSVVHIEMYDGRTCCGFTLNMEERVWQQDWHAEPEAIQRATCEQCLLRVFMFGDSAAIALKRMGMKVEVRDAPAEVEAS